MYSKTKHLCSSAILVFFALCSATLGADTNPDSLLYFGHAFLQIKTAAGKNIYIDPYNVNAFKDSADIVLVTHEHNDHNEISRVKQKKTCLVIRAVNAVKAGVYQSFTIDNIKITAVAAYNTNHLKNQCVGFVLEFDGIKLYHSGDTGKIPEMVDLANYNLDYALLCMDGIYTMKPEEATEAAAMINAKYDMPIHTMPPPDTYSDAIVARFTSPNKIIVKPGTSIQLESSATAVEYKRIIPQGYRLNQNYPNPFNPSTKISYEIPSTEFVSLRIYDLLGREIETLVNQIQLGGNYVVDFNAGKYSLAGGIYFYRLQVGNYSETKKLVLMK